jgi:hypothetical protein
LVRRRPHRRIHSAHARRTLVSKPNSPSPAPRLTAPHFRLLLPRRRIIAAIAILAVLIFSKYFYMACLGSYYTFYLIEKFQVSIQTSQLLLFVFFSAPSPRARSSAAPSATGSAAKP